MAQIVLEDVWKVFPDGTEAVRSFDLDIADGEHVRCLFNLGGATIDIADHGQGGVPIAELNGADPAHLPPCGALWLKLEGTN